MLYVIVHKGRVVLGPLAWAQKYYTDVLKIRHRVQANIPGQAPETLPYVIDEDTKIHLVEENKPNFDAMTEYHYGPLWDLSNDVVIANYEVKQQEIEVSRNNFRNLAAFERYKKEITGVKVTIQDTEVTGDTSREGRNTFLQKLAVMGDEEVANWKFPEGWLALTKTNLNTVVQAGAAHIQAAFDWEKEINDQIDAAETAEELHAIEIETKPERQLQVEE
jgi:hypothetical protein